MEIADKVKEWQEYKKKYELGGGPQAIDRVHKQGKLTARERIARLVDPGSFRELNLWAKPTRTGYDIDTRESPGDASVIGIGKVEGRPVSIYAHDFTVLGGTQSSVQNWKVCKAMDTAVRLGIPYIGLIDSGGVRIYDAFGTPAGRGVSNGNDVWYSPAVANGIVPSISLVLGASYAGTAYSPMLADAFFMVNKPYCYMSLSSPELLKTVTFVDVTREEIGGPKLHAEVTGSCDYLGETEDEVILKGRELLTYLPSNCREKPPYKAMGDDRSRTDENLLKIIPPDLERNYDVRQVITGIVDKGQFLELKKDYARNIVVCFARLDGNPVGIVANNPMVGNGAMDIRSSEKAARFVRYCDAYNIPLVFLVDTPGFISDMKQEKEGLARHAAMLVYAICEATVPKVAVYLRKCYQQGYYSMGTRLMGVDFSYAWPTARIELAGFDESIQAIYGKARNQLTEQQVAEFNSKFFNFPYQPAALLMVDDIISPADTRPVVIDALEAAEKKSEPRPRKKHGNIPL